MDKPDTGNKGRTGHRMKTEKTPPKRTQKNARVPTQHNQKDEQLGPHHKTGGNTGVRER